MDTRASTQRSAVPLAREVIPSGALLPFRARQVCAVRSVRLCGRESAPGRGPDRGGEA